MQNSKYLVNFVKMMGGACYTGDPQNDREKIKTFINNVREKNLYGDYDYYYTYYSTQSKKKKRSKLR